MRLWECPQTDRHTHTHTNRQTQTDFIICPMLYAIAMGQINIYYSAFSLFGAVLGCLMFKIRTWWNCSIEVSILLSSATTLHCIQSVAPGSAIYLSCQQPQNSHNPTNHWTKARLTFNDLRCLQDKISPLDAFHYQWWLWILISGLWSWYTLQISRIMTVSLEMFVMISQICRNSNHNFRHIIVQLSLHFPAKNEFTYYNAFGR